MTGGQMEERKEGGKYTNAKKKGTANQTQHPYRHFHAHAHIQKHALSFSHFIKLSLFFSFTQIEEVSLSSSVTQNRSISPLFRSVEIFCSPYSVTHTHTHTLGQFRVAKPAIWNVEGNLRTHMDAGEHTKLHTSSNLSPGSNLGPWEHIQLKHNKHSNSLSKLTPL